MEDFEFAGKMYKRVEISAETVRENEACFGCAFKNNDEYCGESPDCSTEDKVFYIFVETSQNALQQEQEASS